MTPQDEITLDFKVDQLIETAAAVKRALNVRSFFVMVAFLIGVLILIDNNGLGRDIKSIVTTLQHVTGPEAQQRQAEGTKAILKSNAEEVDCRNRRMHALMAAPFNADLPCKAQTPLEVYPGKDGR